MGLTRGPENSNPIFPVLDRADAAYSPVPNLNAIANHKSPSHSSLVNIFSELIAQEAT
jgi:hypothetical protein